MALSAQQLALHVARALEQARGAPVVLAYAWPQVWAGNDELTVDGRAIPIHQCESVLDVRERLAAEGDQVRVLLVGPSEAELGEDVLARVFRHRLLHVDRWQIVEEAFGTRQIDPRLYALPWMAEALLETPLKRSGASWAALTYERAIEFCLAPIFSLDDGAVELEGLLVACERSSATWQSLPSERRDVYSGFLRSRVGSVATAILGAVEAGHGHAVLPIGLACEVLYSDNTRTIPELRDSRIRLESYLGGHRLSDSDGKVWASAAERLALRRAEPEQYGLFRGAVDLLKSLGAGDLIAESGLLPDAHDLRLERVGQTIRQFLKKPEAISSVEQAVRQVLSHRLFPTGHPGSEAAMMALRLCRCEVVHANSSLPSELVRAYVADGAWEDWARRMLRGVRPDSLAQAVSKLLERVSQRRLEADRLFATQLAHCTSTGAILPKVLPVESALDVLIAPLAELAPLVVIVLDGMSWDVYLAIGADLARQGWTCRRADNAPLALLAAIPSVTEFSRTSLLSGRLTRGTSASEKQAFRSHAGLLRHSRAGKSPQLLHKAELVSGNQLSDAATRLLADPNQRVVGLVLNAVDDALSKSDQIRINWSLETIPLLAAILDLARRGSRAVIITSDHGHVLDSGSELRPGGDAERWRLPELPADDGELKLSGPRIRALMDTDVIVPWKESIRYAIKKNGYHGGIARQEMLVPCGIWMPEPSMGVSLALHVDQPPSWWDVLDDQPLASTTTTTRPADRNAQPDLFAARGDRGWLEKLLASAVLGRQRARVGRIALDDERLSRLLKCLDQRGGRATADQLSAAVRQPPLRMRGIISAMQRMLNLDGYPVISMESGSNTVLLDLQLLKTQFEL